MIQCELKQSNANVIIEVIEINADTLNDRNLMSSRWWAMSGGQQRGPSYITVRVDLSAYYDSNSLRTPNRNAATLDFKSKLVQAFVVLLNPKGRRLAVVITRGPERHGSNSRYHMQCYASTVCVIAQG